MSAGVGDTARFLGRRALAAALILVAISALCFAMLDFAPGDPARSVLKSRSGGRTPSAVQVAELRAAMGLDDPLPRRYLRWAGDAITGDLGTSYLTGRTVRTELADTLPWTVLLLAVATVFSLVGAVVVGVVAGLTRTRWLRRGIEVAMFVLGGMPGFVTALLLLSLGAAVLRVLPSGGIGRPGQELTAGIVAAHLVLPAAALAFGHHFGAYVRLVQTGIHGLRDAAHVQNARARGLAPWTVLHRHLLGPALVPFVTRLGVGTGALLAGSYAIEVIFSWPGMGRLAITAGRAEDYPVLTAVVLLTAVVVILANLIGELAVSGSTRGSGYPVADAEPRWSVSTEEIERGRVDGRTLEDGVPSAPTSTRPRGLLTLALPGPKRVTSWGALGVLLGLGLLAAAAPLLTAFDPLATDTTVPGLHPGAPGHLLGTDLLGRDLFTRLLYGARTSLLVGLVAAGITVLAGTLIGALAAVGPRWLDELITRVADTLLSFPLLVVALALSAVMGPSIGRWCWPSR